MLYTGKCCIKTSSHTVVAVFVCTIPAYGWMLCWKVLPWQCVLPLWFQGRVRNTMLGVNTNAGIDSDSISTMCMHDPTQALVFYYGPSLFQCEYILVPATNPIFCYTVKFVCNSLNIPYL